MARSKVTVAVLACLAALIVGAPPVGAHGDYAVLSLLAARPTVDGEGVTIEVAMVYESDDDPVLEAAIRVNGTSSDGVALLPIQMVESAEPGHYAVTAQLGATSGSWELRILSEEPEAKLTFDYDPADPGATETGASATSARVERPGLSVPFLWIGIGCGAVAAVALVVRIRHRRERASSAS